VTNYIALAVPFFFLFIGVELWAARRRGVKVYRLGDALTDLACGTTQQVTLLFGNGILLAGYIWVYDHYRLAHLDGWVAWVVAFFAVDFLYYWWHRLSHRVNFMWAGHVVHHSSEDYNLAVALRQSILTNWTAWPLHALMALGGVPPLAYATMESLNTLYQFWIHTQLIGRLGPLEHVVNTPSLHRVHHGINPRYLDKNYGGTLIVWDWLFGTLEEEREPVVYGLVKPLRSFSPLWAQVHYLVDLARVAWAAPSWLDKLRVWVAPPTWQARGLPAGPQPAEVAPETFRKYDPPVAARRGRYLVWQFAPVMAATFALMLLRPRLPASLLAAGGALVVLSLVAVGALVENRRWAAPLEGLRLALVAGALVLLIR
jgi:sterol desaturase/sphingolipid hydroxylase (fatty acid hydroxylase superfamily)